MATKLTMAPPPKGYVKEIAAAVGCSTVTVWKALRKGGRGMLAERCRAEYNRRFNPDGEKIKRL